MELTAELSLYPLREDYEPPIRALIDEGLSPLLHHDGIGACPLCGADVIEENLRQLCVWSTQANATVKLDAGMKWWEYAGGITCTSTQN